MRMKVDIVTRSVADLRQEKGLSAAKLRAFESNPYLKNADSLGKIAGLCEGVEAGGEYVFPLRLKTPHGELDVLAGSTLRVDVQYRRCGLGLELPELRWQKSPSKVALGAGLSQMAVPVHQLLDYHVFLLPRHMMLWKSRVVVEMKFAGILSKIVSALIDVAIDLYALVLRGLCAIKLKGSCVQDVPVDDERGLKTVADMIAQNDRPYSEVHDLPWLKWHLTETFSNEGPALLRVASKGDRPIAFYMIKRRFHEKASHRGFKNVYLGSIIEWDVLPEFKHELGWVLISAGLELRKMGCDAVELPTEDVAVSAFLRRLGWRVVGEGNFVIKAGPQSPIMGDASFGNQTCWRLRPAMGDNGLS